MDTSRSFRNKLIELFEHLTNTKWTPLIKTRVDPTTAMALADAFEEAEHSPECPHTQEAYQAFCRETELQFVALVDAGLEVIPHPGEGQPYTRSPPMFADVCERRRICFYPTISGHGDGGLDLDQTRNPLMADSGVRIGKTSLLQNDVFRIVHDVWGHALEQNNFHPDGEENAWRSHLRMYSSLAARAMTTETRGQNSWVNYGPNMRSKLTGRLLDERDPGWLKIPKRPYAKQKMVLLPEKFCRIDQHGAPCFGG